MTRVVLITSHAPSLINFRGGFITYLVSQGAEVVAMAPNFDADSRRQLAELGGRSVDFKLKRTGINPLVDVLSVLDLYTKLRLVKADIVLSYFIKPVVYGTFAAWMARVPNRFAMIEGLGYVFTHPARDLNWKGRSVRQLVTVLYRGALSLAKKVVFLNPDDQRDFVDRLITKQEKTICLGGIGIDLQKWRFMPLPSKMTSFLMVARLLREKGVYEYAAAAALVKQKYPAVNFVLLGGLDENPGAISVKQITDWHESGVLSWYGHVPVAEFLAQASVFVLPSYREGVPVSTMEAMAMGRPILTTDVPGCRETVSQGVNGFMVEPRNAMALADKMVWMIENASYLPAMGRASRKMAEEKFNAQTINAKLTEIILTGAS